MTLEENKQWLNSALYGYTEAKFRDRFKGIILTESAMMKMGTVFGFLATHEELIQNFFDQLEFLNQHEMVVSNPNASSYTVKVPNKITELSDDGTLFGFSFIQMIISTRLEVNEKGLRFRDLTLWNIPYTFGMNGGFLFHGFGNQNFSVTLSNNIGWQIHT